MNRTYRVQARYGYYAIDEHTAQAPVRRAVRGLSSREQAEAIAAALNEAYHAGRQDGARDIARATEDLHTVAMNLAACLDRLAPLDDPLLP